MELFTRGRRVGLSLLVCLFTLLTFLNCGKGKKVPGLENFAVGVIEDRLYASFVATSLDWDTGISSSIPGLSNSAISIAPNIDSPGTVFQVSIGFADLLNGGKPFPQRGLPDGRPIPDIEGGTLPRWDVTIDKLKLSAYLSNEAFGLFLPLKLKAKNGVELPWTVSMKITDNRGNVIGKAYAIPSRGAKTQSGVFVLLLTSGPPFRHAMQHDLSINVSETN